MGHWRRTSANRPDPLCSTRALPGHPRRNQLRLRHGLRARMDFVGVRPPTEKVPWRIKTGEPAAPEATWKREERRPRGPAARLYEAARVISLSADEIARLSEEKWTAFANEVKSCNGLE